MFCRSPPFKRWSLTTDLDSFFLRDPDFLKHMPPMGTPEERIVFWQRCLRKRPILLVWFWDRVLGDILDIDCIFSCIAPLDTEQKATRDLIRSCLQSRFFSLIDSEFSYRVKHDHRPNSRQSWNEFPQWCTCTIRNHYEIHKEETPDLEQWPCKRVEGTSV